MGRLPEDGRCGLGIGRRPEKRRPPVHCDRVVSTFPFSAPLYEWKDVPSAPGVVGFDCLKCSVARYFKTHQLSELCVRTWCALNFPLAEKVWHAKLDRSGSIAGGQSHCDFRWSTASDDVSGAAPENRAESLLLQSTTIRSKVGAGGASHVKDRSFRPGAKGIEQVLGPLEASIMEHLWAKGPQALAAVHQALGGTRNIAYTTVHTELARLIKKNLVIKSGAYAEAMYAAKVPRETFVGDVVRSVLRGLLDAHGPVAVHGFVDLIDDNDEARATLQLRLRARDLGDGA